MALQGTLQDFGALETFQLIALQQKTGTLEITNAGQRRPFVFENGLLLAAHETPLRPEDPLVRYLVEAEYIREEDVRVWLTFPNTQSVNPIDLLPNLADISEELVVDAYDLFLQTSLDEILSWPRGRFQFYSKRVGIPSKLVGPWKIEGVLMESMRRLDELADLEAAELPPGLIPQIRRGAATSEAKDRFARAALNRIDGRRSLQEIRTGSALAGYDLYQALRRLRDDNLIDMAEWIPSGPWMETLWRQRARWKTFLYIAGAPAVLMLLTAGIYIFLAHHRAPWPNASGFSFVTAEARASRGAYATAQLMEAYRLRHGSYPPNYSAMVEDGILGERSAREMEGDGLQWTVTAAGTSYWWKRVALAEHAGSPPEQPTGALPTGPDKRPSAVPQIP